MRQSEQVVHEYNHMAETLEHVAHMLYHLNQYRKTKCKKQLFQCHYYESLVRKNLKQIPTQNQIQTQAA